MPEIVVAGGATLLGAALLLLPGGILVRLLGLRGLLAIAVAPACSMAVLGCGAVAAALLGVRWGLGTALVCVLLSTGLALAVRALTGAALPSRAAAADPPVGRGDRAALVAAAVLAVLPVPLASGGLGSSLQRWDAVFHLAALRLVEQSGSASTLTLGSLSYGDGRDATYPAAWHALASLLPGPPTAVLTIGASLSASLPWVVGCAALALELARSRRPSSSTAGVVGTAAVLAALATAAPMSLWMGWGHVPNAAGLALVPAVVALGLRVLREPRGRAIGVLVLATGLVGTGLTHPNAVLAAGVLLLPVVAATVARASAADVASGRRVRAVVVPVLALAAAVGAVAAFLTSPLAASVTGYDGHDSQPLGVALAQVLIGDYRLWPSAVGIVIGLLALVGAGVAARRRQWLLPAMLVVAWLLYLDAATGGHLQLARLWYTSPARLSVVVSAVAVPAATAALLAGAALMRRRVAGRGLALAAAVLALVLSVASVDARSYRVANVFEDEPGHPPQFVTTGELAMIQTLPEVTHGTLLGSPFSGASSAYGLVGVPVVFPVAGQVWSQDQHLVMDHLAQLAAGTAPASVCDAVERLGIRYLYQDSRPYQVDRRYQELDQLEMAGATVVAEGDTARVVELPPCDE